MTSEIRKKLSDKYCPRFGQLAVELGFMTEAQLTEAMARQVRDELQGTGHRLLGEILFADDVMSAAQIDQVMTKLFQQIRQQERGTGEATDPL